MAIFLPRLSPLVTVKVGYGEGMMKERRHTVPSMADRTVARQSRAYRRALSELVDDGQVSEGAARVCRALGIEVPTTWPE